MWRTLSCLGPVGQGYQLHYLEVSGYIQQLLSLICSNVFPYKNYTTMLADTCTMIGCNFMEIGCSYMEKESPTGWIQQLP